MATKTYDVHRSMHGDGRDYEPGDTRELTEADARELVELGALSLKGEAPKEREPAVRHTFGTAEQTGHLVMTSASGGNVAPIAVPTAGDVVQSAIVKPTKAPKA